MTFDQFMQTMLHFLPDATVGEDNDGQIVIYTNMKQYDNGEVDTFEPEEEISYADYRRDQAERSGNSSANWGFRVEY